MTCKECGRCCVNNGLIPPLIPGEAASDWLWCLVNRLRAEFGAIAEDFPCVFLTDGMQCSIHEQGKPQVCVDFACEEEPTP